MGIKLLSTLLKSQCADIVQKKHLSQLYGKKICIDISIYLYRFKTQDALIEKFYLMCSLFKHYNIKPIFVFDGKPPPEKRETLENRRKSKKEAWKQYENLLEYYGNHRTKEQDDKLFQLKRKAVKITREDINNIKELLDAYGMMYIKAHGEADRLCASLVLKKKVFAVLTEDMDLFALGCSNVLRYISLTNHTCMLYNLKKILTKLSININDFRVLCVLSGNDYYNSKKNIFYYLKLYNRFQKKPKNEDFMTWLLENNYLNKNFTDYIFQSLSLYQNVSQELNNYKYFMIKIGHTDIVRLQEILKKERFIFVN